MAYHVPSLNTLFPGLERFCYSRSCPLYNVITENEDQLTDQAQLIWQAGNSARHQQSPPNNWPGSAMGGLGVLDAGQHLASFDFDPRRFHTDANQYAGSQYNEGGAGDTPLAGPAGLVTHTLSLTHSRSSCLAHTFRITCNCTAHTMPHSEHGDRSHPAEKGRKLQL